MWNVSYDDPFVEMDVVKINKSMDLNLRLLTYNCVAGIA